MLTCLLDNEKICSLDLYNEYGIRDSYLEKQWRRASQNERLVCEECTSIVILKAGHQKTPHFAHKGKGLTNCIFKHYPESEERRKAKQLIYNYLKKSHEGKPIHVNYQHKTGVRSDFNIEASTNKSIVIELQRINLKTDEWDRKNKAYLELNIKPLWILFGNFDKEFFKRLPLFDTHDNILRLIDTDAETLTLVKKMVYYDKETNKPKYEDYYHCSYKISGTDYFKGNILQDFHKKFEEKAREFLLASKHEEKKEKAYKATKAKRESSYYKKTTYASGQEIPEYKPADDEVPLSFSNRVGTCVYCGQRTNEWWTYDGKTGTCKCNNCKHKQT